MGPRHLLQMALLLVAQAVLPEASLYCIHLEYWSPDNKSCRSCLELYGPPPSLDHEFEENCGFDDFGNNLRHPFRKCSSGKCNPDGADLCHPCGGGALARTPSSPAGSLPFTAEKNVGPWKPRREKLQQRRDWFYQMLLPLAPAGCGLRAEHSIEGGGEGDDKSLSGT
uniref:IGF-like family receptor 1 n=1 Tax=Castor canadensis TaxID=51338 RepID=A0A8C0WHJ6_CASCN